MRAWPLKTHRQHPASRTVHSACEVAAMPGGTGQLSRARRLLEATGADRLPTARLQRAVTLNPRTGISRVHNSPRTGIPESTTLRNDLT
jgi:hypothetical protein